MPYIRPVLKTKETQQNVALVDRPEYAANSTSAYVWPADNWNRLDRFLILGSENGAYYVGDRPLSIENVIAVRECLLADGPRVVRTVVEVSTAEHAPKNDPALFVLAMSASPNFADAHTNAAALEALPQVARTGTHLCTFAAFIENLRGWGRALRSAIADWYLNKPAAELAYQILECPHRSGWAHRDLLRLSHPKAATPAHNALFQWTVEGEPSHLATAQILTGDLRQVYAYELAKKAAGEGEIVRLIEDYRLTHEMIPSEWKSSAAVWEALLETMPYAALVGNLGELTAVGLLSPQSPATALAVARIIDRKRIANSRVHPVALLAALLTYRQGHGEEGDLIWEPVSSIIDALDRAFHVAFDHVEATGQRIYLAIDASGSMLASTCSGMSNLSAALAAAALAMLFARTESKYTIAAFHETIWHVNITAADRLDRACDAIQRAPFGTDASLPFTDALDRGIAVDAFVIVTDNEAWAGEQHPVPALQRYRRATGIPTKLVVISMAANGYTIAGPDDAFQMDVAGFDASVPAVVTSFIQGRSA